MKIYDISLGLTKKELVIIRTALELEAERCEKNAPERSEMAERLALVFCDELIAIREAEREEN